MLTEAWDIVNMLADKYGECIAEEKSLRVRNSELERFSASLNDPEKELRL